MLEEALENTQYEKLRIRRRQERTREESKRINKQLEINLRVYSTFS